MIVGVTMLIISFIYLLLTGIIYYSKKRIENIENKIYNYIVITTFIGIALELCCIVFVPYRENYYILNEFVNRGYLIYILTWVTLFTKYIYEISIDNNKIISLYLKNNKKLINNIFVIIYILFFIGLLILPLKYYYNGSSVYSYGPAANLLYIINFIAISIWIICLIINIKEVGYKKYIPLFTFIIGAIINMIIRNINPGILLITVTQTFITIMMYYTIENPDIQMLNEVSLAKVRAEKANNAKTDFLSSMSHEIRTPLNVIMGYSEELRNEDNKEKRDKDIDDIILASQNLLEIVNGILDINKIESGNMEINNEEYNPKELLKDIIKLVSPRINKKKLKLNENTSNLPFKLKGDKNKIREIILNLLTNAIKYTDKGTIDINMSYINKNTKDYLKVEVKDTGRGIKEENIDKLFTKFNRLDEDKNSTKEGTGLGLAITKSLVDIINGKIEVKSKYGSGSTFIVTIPQEIIKGKNIEEDKIKNKIEDSSINYDDYSNSKVLIVDDNNLNIKVATKFLNKYNINPDSCTSGKECIKKISNKGEYDIIFMDDMMPEMSGTETCKKIKESGIKTPIVVLTANAIKGQREEYLDKGFDDYLSKPINNEELKRILNIYLKNN